MTNTEVSIPIEGIRVEIREGFLAVMSKIPLKTLSSAVLNGGLREANAIINCQVQKDYDHANPQSYLAKIAGQSGLSPKNVIGMMTAVDVHDLAIVTQQHHGLTVSVIVTAGLSNAADTGEPSPSMHSKVGTINIILLIDGNPTDTCMVEAIKTITEAKSVALRELDIRNPSSFELASGTTTDAVVVACTERGNPIEYAGTAVRLGKMIGISVTKAVKTAIKKTDGIIPSRPIVQRLRERGITFEDLLQAALELYRPHPGVETRMKASEMLKKGLESTLLDINVAALILSGLRLEEDGIFGLIPGLSNVSYKKDPSFFLADEILGMALANYIAGTKGIFEFVRFDKSKPGILKRLGPVLDDIIGGILAGVSSKMYSEALSSNRNKQNLKDGR
jgi:alpha-ribazole phosphatase CobZ